MKTYITIFLLFISFHIQVKGQTDQPSACNCCSEKHRQFDFWLGEWEAFSNGNLAGTNSISLLQDSCLIRENWISAGGTYTGTSYNFYNEANDQWQQLWIDNQGGYLELHGNFEANRMVLSSEEMTSQKGEKYRNRITWTDNPDGTVRQQWEISKDGGESWEAVFDGLYKKK